jgi:hypothetical protein
MRRAAPANWSNLPNRNGPRFYTAWATSRREGWGLRGHAAAAHK